MNFLFWTIEKCLHPQGQRFLYPTFETICNVCGAANEELGRPRYKWKLR